LARYNGIQTLQAHSIQQFTYAVRETITVLKAVLNIQEHGSNCLRVTETSLLHVKMSSFPKEMDLSSCFPPLPTIAWTFGLPF